MTRGDMSAEVVGILFKNIKFFVLSRVPTRSSILNLIEVNGGIVVKLEKQADIVIADHARKDNPPRSISWKWIEESVKQAQLLDKDSFRAGSSQSAPRPEGALKSTKSGRNPYSKDDDVYVYRFVNDPKRASMKDMGNTIYQQLEKENPRHPWQSWRHRYLQYVKTNPPPETLVPCETSPSKAQVSEPTQPTRIAENNSEQETQINDDGEDNLSEPNPPEPQQNKTPPTVSKTTQNRGSSTLNDSDTVPIQGSRASELSTPKFTPEDKERLLYEAKDILGLHGTRREEAWRHWSRQEPKATPEQWCEFFNDHVLPIATRIHRMSEGRDRESTSQTTQAESSQDENIVMGATSQQRELTPVKAEPSEDRLPRTPNDRLTRSARRGIAMNLSPSLAKKLKRSRSPMVIVPSSSGKRVRFSQEREVVEPPNHSRSYTPPSPNVANSVNKSIQRQSTGPSDSSRRLTSQPVNNSTQGFEVVELMNEHDDQTSDESQEVVPENVRLDHSLNNSKRKSFRIWQGNEQPPEDEKENSPRRNPPSRGRERPSDALDMTEQGTEFKLEPAAHYPSIENISFTESESVSRSDGTLKRRTRPRQGKFGRTGKNDDGERDVYDVPSDDPEASPDEPAGEDGSLFPPEQSMEEIEHDTQKLLSGTGPDMPQSDDTFEDAREVFSQYSDDQHYPNSTHVRDFGIDEAATQRASTRLREKASLHNSTTPKSSPPPSYVNQYSAHSFAAQKPPDQLDHLTGNARQPKNSSSLNSRYTSQQHSQLSNRDAIRVYASGRVVSADEYSSSTSSPGSSASQTDSTWQQSPRTYTKTQDLLTRGISQVPDLISMPLPSAVSYDGFDDSVARQTWESQHSDMALGSTQTGSLRQQQSNGNIKTRTIDTQALLDEDTPVLDFSVAAPPDSQQTGQSGSRRSPATRNQSEATSSQIDHFIEFQVQRGYDEDNVISALECTSFHSVRAEEVLRSWRKGQGLPRKPGIFSEQDDSVCLGGNAREMERLEKFHGAELTAQRIELLMEWDGN